MTGNPFNGETRLFATDTVSRFTGWTADKGERITTAAARSLVGKAFAQMGARDRMIRPG